MTDRRAEERAIRRIAQALEREGLVSHAYTSATIAWNEMKAIAREDQPVFSVPYSVVTGYTEWS